MILIVIVGYQNSMKFGMVNLKALHLLSVSPLLVLRSLHAPCQVWLVSVQLCWQDASKLQVWHMSPLSELVKDYHRSN